MANPPRFRWEATLRATGTALREDENGLGSFTQLDATRVSKLSLYEVVQVPGEPAATEYGYHHDVPEGAKAVFVRRRVIVLGAIALNDMERQGYTIIGHEWPDGTGQYFYFENWSDNVFESNSFHAF